VCIGGGGGGGGGSSIAIAQAQMAQQQQLADQQLAEQKREFDVQQTQSTQTLANTKALQDKQQAQVDAQAQLTNTWETGRAAETAKATGSINDAFSQFTPDYYKKYTQDYVDHFTPQVDKQADLASNATLFGLARSGNLQSQTAANQISQNAETKGQALSDVNNTAISATTQERTNVINAKNSLMSQATSDATLGSPITPGSADAITANFNNTASALKNITNQAGDTINTLTATPQFASLGSIFGSAASGANAAISGNAAFGFGQAFNNSLNASSPSGESSFHVGR
jgi:hypothetical protein